MFFSWSTRISLTIDRHNSRFSGMEKESYRLSKSIFKKSRKYDKSLTGRESSALIFSSCKSNFSLSSLNSFIVMRSLRNRSFNFCNLFSTLLRHYSHLLYMTKDQGSSPAFSPVFLQIYVSFCQFRYHDKCNPIHNESH